MYKNLILNILSNVRVYDSFSINTVKRLKRRTDNICPAVRISSIKCQFTRYHYFIAVAQNSIIHLPTIN
jgi:hypothetical protein